MWSTQQSVRRRRPVLTSDVKFAAEDAIRTDLAFRYVVFEVALQAGARTKEISDTVGYALPGAHAA